MLPPRDDYNISSASILYSSIPPPICSSSLTTLHCAKLIMATHKPLSDTHSTPPLISSKTLHIAGILTTVYGLGELPQSSKSISCLWLLHPRLETKKTMESVASTCIIDWNQRQSSDRFLICVAFDQRNHGSREVTPLANEAWRGGNPTHAQDMFR